ncbi:hypothetical protein AAA086_10155 [Dysosmobacter welbionis]|uniref:hypothetical protein n=1 Tax=Dysosmobacter welbionis TaxID=2093857 RepID=UPI0032C0DD40
MERMTKKEQLAGRTVNYIGEDDCFDVWSVPKKFMGNAVDRLAAYEDTGVEPEEIARILDAYGRGMTLRTENAQRLEIVKGIQTDRLRELAQADREGRCVVLPAKPDQTIYQWRKGDDCPSVSRLDGVQINADGEITYPIWNGYLIPEDFGKTVFFTRVEAALRREQDD